jgi:hypothetical protein
MMKWLIQFVLNVEIKNYAAHTAEYVKLFIVLAAVYLPVRKMDAPSAILSNFNGMQLSTISVIFAELVQRSVMMASTTIASVISGFVKPVINSYLQNLTSLNLELSLLTLTQNALVVIY